MGKDFVLGIDPGFSGGLAILRRTPPGSASTVEAALIADMPLLTNASLVRQSKAAIRTEIDAVALYAILNKYQHCIRLAVVEKVSAAPGQGVSSMFRFGEGFGIIRGVLSCIGIKTIYPPPAVWKSGMNLSADKALSLQRAKALLGQQLSDRFVYLKKHDGRAEAVLLAEYGISKGLGIK